MLDLRPAARAYIAALLTTATLLLVIGLADWPSFGTQRAVLAVAFGALMTLAYLFPLHFAYKTKMALDTSVIFAVILLFSPGIAMMIVGLGTLLAQAIRRQPVEQGVFNASQTMLQAGVGAFLLAAVDWQRDNLRFDHPGQMAMIVLAALVMHAINTFSVAGIVGLQTGMSPWLLWRQTVVFGHAENLSQLAIGLLAAVIVDAHAWTLPLLVLPAFVVYLSLERNIRLRQQTLDAVQSLADIVDLRDPYTADHSRRVAAYARALAVALDLTPDEVELVALAARVHDIGKIVVDRDVLSKEGPLDAAEGAQLRRHPETGAEVLGNFPQFMLATTYVRHHHERLDGHGYPDRLCGQQIPLGARIISVADALDAMATARPYRAALPLDVVLAEFRQGRGDQWDERVVDALLGLLADGAIDLQPLTPAEPAQRAAKLLGAPTVA